MLRFAIPIVVFALVLLPSPSDGRIFIQHWAKTSTKASGTGEAFDYPGYILELLQKLLAGEDALQLALKPKIWRIIEGMPRRDCGNQFVELDVTASSPPTSKRGKLLARVAAAADPLIIRRHSYIKEDGGSKYTDARSQLSAADGTMLVSQLMRTQFEIEDIGTPKKSIGIGIPTPQQWEDSGLYNFYFLYQNFRTSEMSLGTFRGYEHIALGHELIHADRLWLGEKTQNHPEISLLNPFKLDRVFFTTMSVPSSSGKQELTMEEKCNWVEVAVVGFHLAPAYIELRTSQEDKAQWDIDMRSRFAKHKRATSALSTLATDRGVELIYENDLRKELEAPLRCRYAPVFNCYPGEYTDSSNTISSFIDKVLLTDSEAKQRWNNIKNQQGGLNNCPAPKALSDIGLASSSSLSESIQMPAQNSPLQSNVQQSTFVVSGGWPPKCKHCMNGVGSKCCCDPKTGCGTNDRFSCLNPSERSKTKDVQCKN